MPKGEDQRLHPFVIKKFKTFYGPVIAFRIATPPGKMSRRTTKRRGEIPRR
jgi:hypothetical protein